MLAIVSIAVNFGPAYPAKGTGREVLVIKVIDLEGLRGFLRF